MSSRRTVVAGSHRALGIALLAWLTLVALPAPAASAAGVVPTDEGPVRGGETPALEAGRNKLVVDLSPTEFMDSTGLGVLVAVNRSLTAEARLAIVCPRANLMQIFELSGMDGAFAIFPTLEEALAYVRGPGAGAR